MAGIDDGDRPPRLPTNAFAPVVEERLAIERAPSIADQIQLPERGPREEAAPRASGYVAPRMGVPLARAPRFTEAHSSLAQSAIAAIVRALRGLQIYSDNNQQRKVYFEGAAEKVEVLFKKAERIDLTIHPDRIALRNDVLHFHPDPTLGFPGQLHGAGLRRLVLDRGIDRHELLRLLAALATDFTLPENRELTLPEVLARYALVHVHAIGEGPSVAVPQRAPAQPNKGLPAAKAKASLPAAQMPSGARRSGFQVVPAKVAKDNVTLMSADEHTQELPSSALLPIVPARSPSPRSPTRPPRAPTPASMPITAPTYAALALSAPSGIARDPSEPVDLVKVITSVSQVVDRIYGRGAVDDEATVIATPAAELSASLRALIEDLESDLPRPAEVSAEITAVHQAARAPAPRKKSRRASKKHEPIAPSRAREQSAFDEETVQGVPGKRDGD